jgi:hypothetical protein
MKSTITMFSPWCKMRRTTHYVSKDNETERKSPKTTAMPIETSKRMSNISPPLGLAGAAASDGSQKVGATVMIAAQRGRGW